MTATAWQSTAVKTLKRDASNRRPVFFVIEASALVDGPSAFSCGKLYFLDHARTRSRGGCALVTGVVTAQTCRSRDRQFHSSSVLDCLRREIIGDFSDFRSAFLNKHYAHSNTINIEIQTFFMKKTMPKKLKKLLEDHFKIKQKKRTSKRIFKSTMSYQKLFPGFNRCSILMRMELSPPLNDKDLLY